jgi:hypothetical protein
MLGPENEGTASFETPETVHALTQSDIPDDFNP